MDADAGSPGFSCGSIEILAGEFKTGVDLSSLWDTRAEGDIGDVSTSVTPVADGIEFTLGPEGTRAGLTSSHAFSLENSTVEIEFETLATEARTNVRFTARNYPSSDKSFSVSFENETTPQIAISDGVGSASFDIPAPPTRWKFSHLAENSLSLDLFDEDGLLFTQRINAQVPIDSLRLGLTVTPFPSNTQPAATTTTKLNRITAPQREDEVAFCPIFDVNDTFEGPELSSLWAHHVPDTTLTPCRLIQDGMLGTVSAAEKNCIVESSKGFLFDAQNAIEVQLQNSDSETRSSLHLILDDRYEKQLAIVFDSDSNMLSLLNSATTELVSQTPKISDTPLFLRLSRTASEVLFQWSEDGESWDTAGSILSAEVPIGPYKIILISQNDSESTPGGSTFDNLIGTTN